MPSGIKSKEGKLDVGGLSIGYLEAGAGGPVIALPARGEPFAPLMSKLAESYRLFCLDLSTAAEPRRLDEGLAPAVTALGIEHYSVIGTSSSASHALALALSAPETVDKLILISPMQPAAQSFQVADLAQIKADTLILVGTEDSSGAAEAGRLLQAAIPSCHLSFVYGAAHALMRDRLTACADTIRDFLAHGDQFIIEHQSQIIRP